MYSNWLVLCHVIMIGGYEINKYIHTYIHTYIHETETWKHETFDNKRWQIYGQTKSSNDAAKMIFLSAWTV
jgi:hypothetical protein